MDMKNQVKKTKMMSERKWNGIQGKHIAATEASNVTEEHRQSTDNDKDKHDGKRPPYFLLTFLCAGLQTAAAILFCLYTYICLFCSTTESVLRLSNAPSATACPP